MFNTDFIVLAVPIVALAVMYVTTKWEYKAVALKHGAVVEDVLNKYGDKGWELVTSNVQFGHVVCYLKRVRS